MTLLHARRYNRRRMTPTLYLPVENQVRELDAKLLFGCTAAARGFPTVLGFKPHLYFAMPHMAPGVFIAKSMRAGSALMFDIITALGHMLVAWDEESLVRYASPEYYSWRFSERTFRPLRHLFAWGHDDAELFRGYPGVGAVAIHETGNPRADLLRRQLRPYFEPAAAALRARHGEFVLVNTNFSFVNPFLRSQALVLSSARGGEVRTGRTAAGLSEQFALGMAAHQQAIFDHFRLLLPALARRFPARTIVLRPHPSEDHDLWRALLAAEKNVVVAHEGNVLPWLLAAEVLVHNGCTTAVECAMLERPAVSYRPVQSASFDYVLPNSLSHETFSVDDTVQAVDEVLHGRLGLVDAGRRAAVFARHLAATDGPLASTRIVDVLEREMQHGAGMPTRSVLRAGGARVVAAARTLLKRFNMQRSHHWASSRYHDHIYPEVALADVDARIRRFDALLGGFDQLTTRRLSRFLFQIERRGS
jgi:surface carbohydrate biosynthesis protein